MTGLPRVNVFLVATHGVFLWDLRVGRMSSQGLLSRTQERKSTVSASTIPVMGYCCPRANAAFATAAWSILLFNSFSYRVFASSSYAAAHQRKLKCSGPRNWPLQRQSANRNTQDRQNKQDRIHAKEGEKNVVLFDRFKTHQSQVPLSRMLYLPRRCCGPRPRRSSIRTCGCSSSRI